MPTKKEIENLFDVAKEKFTSGSFEASIKILDEIIELNPDKGSILLAYFYRANVNSEIGEDDNAIIDFSKMIEIDPEAQNYRNRAQGYTKIKNYELAIKDIDKAIEIDPQQSEYYYFRGLCKSVLKDRNSAIQDYVTAEKLGYKDEQGFPPSELIAKSWYDEFIERMNSKEEGKLKDFTDSLVNKEGKGKVLRFSHQLRKTKK